MSLILSPMGLRPGLLATLVSAAAVGLSACGSSGPETFERDGFPFTFEYPSDFRASDDVSFDNELGAQPDETTAIGLDDANGIVLQRFTLNIAIDEDNIDQAKAEFDGLVGQVDSSASGEIGQSAGFPSLSYDAVSVMSPPDGESRITVLFDGDQEYLINCQSAPDQREQVNDACDQAIGSLQGT